MITVDTKLVPLLGKPLRQSFSPRMQNETYAKIGLPYHYFPLEVENDHLPDLLNALRHMNTPGLAVTKPNKVKVLEYLDDVDELARKMGAVNTVVCKDGKLIGYNTDGEGFIRSLEAETDCNIAKSTFFCFGAGGAGRAMCSSLAYHGAPEIVIVDCFDQAAESLAEDINKTFAPVARWIPFAEAEKMAEAIKNARVVMNASGVGMYPKLEETPIDKTLLGPGQIAFDATYNPLKTRFLKDAESMGCTILNGIGMCLYQGAIQIHLWSGQPEPVEVMRESLMRIVEEAQAAQK